MDWVQVLSIMASILASSYYIHREIQQDIKAQSARTDKLYEMFVDLQREIKEEAKQFHGRVIAIETQMEERIK
jgi:hypothetical protein